MEPPSPDPSFAALDRLATGSAPALRTVSLTKNVWERETAYLRRTARSASLAASTQGLEAAVAGAAAGPPGANAPPTPPARQVGGCAGGRVLVCAHAIAADPATCTFFLLRAAGRPTAASLACPC